jgi:hypothetical protein
MRKTIVLSVLLLSLAVGLVWAQFWKNYTDTDRRATAEAYWLAGSQYQKIGQPEVGGAFKVMAREIDPTLDPNTISDQTLPSAAELLAQGRTTEITAGAPGIPTGAVSSFFLRFLGALVEKDPAGIAGFLDGSVYLTRIPAEVTRSDAQAAMADFFKNAPLKDLKPSQVYNLDSIVVTREPPAAQAAWGEAYTLTINAAADYSQYVSFWDMTQQFFVRRVSGNWYVFGYGPTMPPLTWTPQEAEPPAAQQAPTAAADSDAGSSISQAFTSCVSALLKKDAEGALAYMSQSIHFLRMRQSVTRDELRTTLQGYFDTADFKNAGASDVLNLDSVFVEPSASPVDGVTGDIYMLNVQSRMDLSAGIPFWSSYQRYYFVQEAGNWVIFAIL